MPNSTDDFHAGMVMDAAGPAASQRKCVGARSAKGVYTMTLDVPIARADCLIDVTIENAAARLIPLVVHTSDTVKTISIVDQLGAAQDAAFSAKVERLGWGTYE